MLYLSVRMGALVKWSLTKALETHMKSTGAPLTCLDLCPATSTVCKGHKSACHQVSSDCILLEGLQGLTFLCGPWLLSRHLLLDRAQDDRLELDDELLELAAKRIRRLELMKHLSKLDHTAWVYLEVAAVLPRVASETRTHRRLSAAINCATVMPLKPLGVSLCNDMNKYACHSSATL